MVPDENTAQGRIVVDASIASMPWKEGDPDCIIDVRDGAAVNFDSGRGKKLEKTLSGAEKAGFIIAEFGIGTNPGLRLSGNLLEDEKVKGTVHIAFGNSASMGGSNHAPIHIDCMIRNPDIYADDVKVMENGDWKV